MASKMVIVKSRGYVDTSRGRHIFTPISRPWRETIDVILSMIVNDKADVWEVLPDKTEVKLTTTNYDKDNRIKPVQEKPLEKAPVLTTPEPVAPSPATLEENPSDNLAEEFAAAREEQHQHDGATFKWEGDGDASGDQQPDVELTEDEPVVPVEADDTKEIDDVPEPIEDPDEESDGESSGNTGDKGSKKRNRRRR